MKLATKIQERPKQQASAIQVKRNLKPDPEMELPYGKFQGRTLGYVMKHEDWYYQYMQDNDLIYKWGLYIPEVPKNRSKTPVFLTEDGEYWVSIREVPGNGVPSEYID